MDEPTTSVQHEPAKKPKKNRTVTLKINRTLLMVGIVAVLVVGAYFFGIQQGKKQQKEQQKTTLSSALDRAPAALSNRWTSIGTVTDVNNSSISVKDSRGETKKATINGDAKVVDRKGTQLKSSDIKKDQRVIISGTKDEKDASKLTATRIRIQE